MAHISWTELKWLISNLFRSSVSLLFLASFALEKWCRAETLEAKVSLTFCKAKHYEC